jgi:4-carboxymuconolactone decarboxylase
MTRRSQPRLAPLDDEQLDPEIRARLGDPPILNIFKTVSHHPNLFRRWMVFGNHVLFKSTLSGRDRELLVLRIGWLCRSGYEWGQHVRLARAEGMTDEEIDRIAAGPDAEGWTSIERALLRATDELHDDAYISDGNWDELAAHYTPEQLLDILFTVGQYNMVSMVLNTLGVQPEEGPFPTMPSASPGPASPD